MNRTTKSKMIGATIAGLFVAGAPIVGFAADEGGDQVMCAGVNACKGHGFLMLTKAECDAAKAKLKK